MLGIERHENAADAFDDDGVAGGCHDIQRILDSWPIDGTVFARSGDSGSEGIAVANGADHFQGKGRLSMMREKLRVFAE